MTNVDPQDSREVRTLIRRIATLTTKYGKPIAWMRFTDEAGTEMLAEVWIRPWAERYGPWPMPSPEPGEELEVA